jgi:hypothetical protein
MIMVLFIVLLVVALGGGSWGYSRYGYAGMSPVALLLVVGLILWLTGHLHF